MESSPSPPRASLRYDAVLKDLFQRDHPTLLKLLSGGIGVKQTLNVELAIVEERRADLLFELEDQSLFLLDFQSTNDRHMGYRVGIYTLVGSQKYKRKVRATVLYTGGASRCRVRPGKLQLNGHSRNQRRCAHFRRTGRSGLGVTRAADRRGCMRSWLGCSG
jgi:hypothetical protein